MKLNNYILTALLASFVASPAFAQNRDQSDVVFKDPSRGKGVQTVLGIAEVLAASALWPGMDRIQQEVASAALELEKANDLSVTEEERLAKVNAILANPGNYTFDVDKEYGENGLKEKVAYRLDGIRGARLVSEAERKAAIEAASQRLAVAKVDQLGRAQNLGLLDRSTRIVRQGASVLLLVDVVGRIYVYNAIEADPTLSPVGTYLMNKVSR